MCKNRLKVGTYSTGGDRNEVGGKGVDVGGRPTGLFESGSTRVPSGDKGSVLSRWGMSSGGPG